MSKLRDWNDNTDSKKKTIWLGFYAYKIEPSVIIRKYQPATEIALTHLNDQSKFQ